MKRLEVSEALPYFEDGSEVSRGGLGAIGAGFSGLGRYSMKSGLLGLKSMLWLARRRSYQGRGHCYYSRGLPY